jgi:hypothetical protein
MISGGLGIQAAGMAIGHSLRQISRHTLVAGNIVVVLSHLFCLFVWWQAFRHSPQRNERGVTPSSKPSDTMRSHSGR